MNAIRTPVQASVQTDVRTGPASLRPVRTFALVALPLGWVILAVPVVLGLPTEPFAMLTTYAALLAPALVITRRRHGRGAVRALLRDAFRRPRPAWWALAAVAALPALAWTAAAALGGARPLSAGLLFGPTGYVPTLLLTLVLVNLWEETAWTGFAQRRLADRWGVVRGAVATAALFAGIHLPLLFQAPVTAANLLRGVAVLLGTAIGLRLVIAYVDRWSAGSLLTVGLLHASFNGTAALIEPGYDWVRVTLTVVVGAGMAAFAHRRRHA